MSTPSVLVVGAGFGGLQVVRELRRLSTPVDITIVDRRNHHLFQPLLYQVAMAGLSPAEIAFPIRSIFSGDLNVSVLLDEVTGVVPRELSVTLKKGGARSYAYVVLACGTQQHYFGHDAAWEEHAPGLKTIEQATEIRRRVLLAYELAEMEKDPDKQRQLLTFIVVGGGPTGVELAGALGEMSRYCLRKDFRAIDPSRTRIILIESGSRILQSFDERLATRATRDLESLGVQVWTKSYVTGIDLFGVSLGEERVLAKTVLWAAGVKPSPLNALLGVPLTKGGLVLVNQDCSLPEMPNVFVIGDQAAFIDGKGRQLPGQAPVAIQQGRFVAGAINADLRSKPRKSFRYFDKGQMATIGRNRAIAESGSLRFAGLLAWFAWLFVHIYYLVGTRNRLRVVFNWAWHYFSYRPGARLIIHKEWRQFR